MDADAIERLRRSLEWAWACKREWQASYERAVQRNLPPSAEFAAKEVAMFEGIIKRYEGLLNGFESELDVMRSSIGREDNPEGSGE